MAGTTKATIRKKAPKGKAHRYNITKNDDGTFSTETHSKPPSGRSSMMLDYQPPTTASHPDLDALHDHIDSVFGGGDQGADSGAGASDEDDSEE